MTGAAGPLPAYGHGMAAPSLRYRWTPQEFLRADAAGVFDGRVELVEGEVWPLVVGDWHGPTTMRCAHLLSADGFVVTQQTLPTGDSLPDPDLWVRAAEAVPVGALSPRVSRWAPSDVLLVVEVSDETVDADLGTKARLYGAAGYPAYWVVTRDAVHEHTAPDARGYRTVTRYGPGDRVPVRHRGTTLAVDDVLGVTSS